MKHHWIQVWQARPGAEIEVLVFGVREDAWHEDDYEELERHVAADAPDAAFWAREMTHKYNTRDVVIDVREPSPHWARRGL